MGRLKRIGRIKMNHPKRGIGHLIVCVMLKEYRREVLWAPDDPTGTEASGSRFGNRPRVLVSVILGPKRETFYLTLVFWLLIFCALAGL